MGNKVLSVTDLSAAETINLDLRCNNDANMQTLYGDCIECVDAIGIKATYYGREAGGKVLATYDTDPNVSDANGLWSCHGSFDSIWIDDWYIYGSAADGRVVSVDPKETKTLGVRDMGSEFPKALNGFSQSPPQNSRIPTAMVKNNITGINNTDYQVQQRVPGFRRYEIKDHLGNVRTVISDIKNPYTTSGSITSWTYLADIRNISNMYPYGMSYPAAATYSADDEYRYGFNGMEKEKSFDSDGDVADFGARIFDANYPVFLSRDPKQNGYSGLSPYQFSNNSPIAYIEFNGEHFGYYIDNNAKEPTVIISMNVYTVTERTEREASNAAELWNNTKFEVDGYKVIFKIQVIRPENLPLGDNVDEVINKFWEKTGSKDPIGNVYAGTETSKSQFLTPINLQGKKTFVGGRTLAGEYVYMNTHYKYRNMGKDERKVGHEFGHLFGLDDNRDGANTCYPKGKSIMEYKDYLSLPTESDVKMIFQYIKDYENEETTDQDHVRVERIGSEKLE